MQINNNSKTTSLFVVSLPTPAWVDPDSSDAQEVKAGESQTFADNPDSSRSACYIFRGSGENSAPFWKGRLRPGVSLDVDPDSGSVTWNEVALTQEQLDAFKALYSDVPDVQKCTLTDLQNHAKTRDPLGELIEVPPARSLRDEPTVSPCNMAIATVVLDSFLVVGGLSALIPNKLGTKVVEQVATEVDKNPGLMSKLQKNVTEFINASNLEKAGALLAIITKLGEKLAVNIVKIILNSLSVLDWVLYGILLLANVVSFFVTEGLANAAAIAFELTINGFFITRDAVACWLTCNPPAETPPFLPVPPYAGKLINHHYSYDLTPRYDQPDSQELIVMRSNVGAPDTHMWDFEPVPGRKQTYYIRNPALDKYIVLSNGANLWLVDSKTGMDTIKGPSGQWVVRPAPSNDGNPNHSIYIDSVVMLSPGVTISMFPAWVGGPVVIQVQPRPEPNQNDDMFMWYYTGIMKPMLVKYILELPTNGTIKLQGDGSLLGQIECKDAGWRSVATISSNGVESSVEVRGWADLTHTYVQVQLRNTAPPANPVVGPLDASVSKLKLSGASGSITAQILVLG